MSPFDYLADVFARVQDDRTDAIDELVPGAWAAADGSRRSCAVTTVLAASNVGHVFGVGGLGPRSELAYPFDESRS